MWEFLVRGKVKLINFLNDLFILMYIFFKECITAENYIKQYNNWCDQYNRYHKALNDWEEMKDKVIVLFFILLFLNKFLFKFFFQSCSSLDKN